MRNLKVKIVDHNLHMNLQTQTAQSAGIDLCAHINEPVTINPGENPKMIPLGICVEPENADKNPCALLLMARSGLGGKKGITLANGVGLIDSDYRGEIAGCFVNLSNVPYTIQPQERVAQLVVVPIEIPKIQIVDKLNESQRGTGGFGSTGK